MLIPGATIYSVPTLPRVVCHYTYDISVVDCPMVLGHDSVYGIVADPCDCTNYYQCEYNTTLEEFIAYQRTCNPCEIWDQDVVTCVWDPAKPDCRFFPSTEDIGRLSLVQSIIWRNRLFLVFLPGSSLMF